MKTNKNGWGAARLGKVHSEKQDNYGEFKMTDAYGRQSKSLKGQYSKYQGNRQGTKGK